MNKNKNDQKFNLRPILEACEGFTSNDFSEINRLNAASAKVFQTYMDEMERCKALPHDESERSLMRNAFRVGFIAGINAGTITLGEEVDRNIAMSTVPVKGKC